MFLKIFARVHVADHLNYSRTMSSRSSRVRGLSAVILAGFAPLVASPTGSVTGLIKDPSGAPVPGVHVILLNGKTNAQRLAVSDSSGVFQFLQIEPASWSLTAEAQGFKRTIVQQTLVQV